MKCRRVERYLALYISDDLTRDEKAELGEEIQKYRKGLTPLIVPITLLRHFTRKYDVTYLRDQAYLDPHPVELKLRNHA